MRKMKQLFLPAVLVAAVVASPAAAQPPARDTKGSSLVARMMAFDKNKDGKLTRDEITDRRLLRLFDQADKNKDGVVTREELEAFAAKQAQDDRGGRGGPGGDRGPGGRGGRSGFGGRGPRGGPALGQVLPPFVQDELKLTDKQKKKVADLQKELDSKLSKILTGEQNDKLKEIKSRRGRPGFGGPGGGRRGGPGGRGGDGDRGPGGRPGRPGGDRPPQ